MTPPENDLLYELKVEQKIEDTPLAYQVLKANTPSGIIVYGKYGDDRWLANPSCRELIAHLLRRVGRLKGKGEELTTLECLKQTQAQIREVLDGQEIMSPKLARGYLLSACMKFEDGIRQLEDAVELVVKREDANEGRDRPVSRSF